MSQEHNIAVKLLDKTYQIKCPPNMVQELQNAAVYVDGEMKKIRDNGKVVGLDRIAVIAALNIAFDLLGAKRREDNAVDMMSSRILEMQKRIEEILTQYEQMEL